MDLRQKQEMRQVIARAIDLTGSRLKDNEVELLYDIVMNPNRYDGLSQTYKHSEPGFSSDGRYTRYSTTTYTLHSNASRVCIEENYRYRDDDDGQTGGHDRTHTKARDILDNIGFILRRN